MAERRVSDFLVAAGASATAARVVRRDVWNRSFSRFARYALRRGLGGGSRPWLYAGAAASGLNLARRYLGRKEEVYRIRLRPGQGVAIREIPRQKRRA